MKNAINLKRTCEVLESFVKFLLICTCLSLMVEGKTFLIGPYHKQHGFIQFRGFTQ